MLFPYSPNVRRFNCSVKFVKFSFFIYVLLEIDLKCDFQNKIVLERKYEFRKGHFLSLIENLTLTPHAFLILNPHRLNSQHNHIFVVPENYTVICDDLFASV